ncbi:putative leader peptide [Kitasatospora sp. NBC_01539]
MQRTSELPTDGTPVAFHRTVGAYARRHVDLQRVASALCPR